jgi:tRNA pseudouridine-54 N-methylase
LDVIVRVRFTIMVSFKVRFRVRVSFTLYGSQQTRPPLVNCYLKEKANDNDFLMVSAEPTNS